MIPWVRGQGRGRRRRVATGLVVLNAWASLFRPDADAQTTPAVPPSGPSQETPSAADAPASTGWPVIEVVGTIVAPPLDMALVLLLDGAGQPRGIGRLKPGDAVEGYRLVEVQTDRATFERDGKRIVVRVGRAGALESAAPGASGSRRPGPIFVPGAVAPVPDLPYVGPPEEAAWPPEASSASPSRETTAEEAQAVGTLLERVLADPALRERLEEARSALRRRLDEAAGAGSSSLGAPARSIPAGGGSSDPAPARTR